MLHAPITGLTFADQERVIAWATVAQFAVAWEAPTGKLLSPETPHAGAIRSISFSAEGLFTSGIDGRVLRWGLSTGQLNETITLRPARLPLQPVIVPVVTLSGDATRALWARTSMTEVYDVGSGDNLFVIPPPSSPPAAVHVNASADGMKVVTLSRQPEGKRFGSCVVWDLATEQRIAEFDIPASSTAAAPAAVISPSGAKLVLATTRNLGGQQVLVIVGYDLKTGKKLAEVEDTNVVGTVTLAAADDTWAVVASTSGRVWAVDYATGRIGEDIDNLPVRREPPVYGPMAFSPDGKRFATAVVGEPFTTYGVRLYDWPRRKATHTFIGHVAPVTAIHFAPDGDSLASGSQDTSVVLWDLTKLDK